MSRIGRKPIIVPDELKVEVKNKTLNINGKKGSLSHEIPDCVDLELQGQTIQLKADYENDRTARMMMGTTYAIIRNMIKGTTEGFSKQLNLVGVGYKATVKSDQLELNLGYSHPVLFDLPKAVKATVAANTKITLESIDKQLLGQVASNIQKLRPPEPYKGKGILFEGKAILRKAGKSGKK